MRKKLLGAVAMLALLPAGMAMAQTQTVPAPDPGVSSPATPLPADQMGGASISDLTADELIGREVVDLNGDSVGEIQDVTLADGVAVGQVMIDVGGFLGIGERTVALDASHLTVEQGDGTIVTSLTKEELEALPAYEQKDGVWQPATD